MNDKSRSQISDRGHVEQADTTDRNVSRHPKTGIVNYDRKSSVAMHPDGRLFAAVEREKDGISSIVLLIYPQNGGAATAYPIEGSARACGSPCIAFENDVLHITWLEKIKNNWRLMHVTYDIEGKKPITKPRIRLVCESLMMHLSFAVTNEGTWIAVCRYDEQRKSFVIELLIETEKVKKKMTFEGRDDHAFHPSLAVGSHHLWLAYEGYAENRYKVCVHGLDRLGRAKMDAVIQNEAYDCKSPDIVCDQNEQCHLTYIGIRDVMHEKLEIIDHAVFAGYARYGIGQEDNVIHIPCVAELKEGLLGAKNYCGYYGLRRYPRMVLLDHDELWLVFEMMFEKGFDKTSPFEGLGLKGGATHGSLVGQKWSENGFGKMRLLHNGGLNYGVPKIMYSDRLTFCYFDHTTEPKNPKFVNGTLDPSKALMFELDKERWKHWKSASQDQLRKMANKQKYDLTIHGQRYQLYWADTHVHSVFSPDAEGEPEEILFYARDKANLDAVAMVDNDFYPYYAYTAIKWETQKALAQIFTKHEKIVVFAGYEYTYHDSRFVNGFNHRYVLYKGCEGTMHRRMDPGSDTIEGLMQKLESQDVISVAHHTTWSLMSAPFDCAAEITSSWRVCMEESDFIKSALERKERFSFIGSSDTHRACPGYGGALTGIYSKSLSKEDLFDAIQSGRTFATSGQAIIVDFRVNGHLIGESVQTSEAPVLSLHVSAPEPLETVEVIKGTKVLFRYSPNDCTITKTVTDTQAQKGEQLYWLRVKTVSEPGFNAENVESKDNVIFYNHTEYGHNFAKAQGPFAWSTPIRVIYE